MEQELGLAGELEPWLKSDLLCEFSDLLDDGPPALTLEPKQAATLGSADLLDGSRPCNDPGSQEGMSTDWLKSLISSQDPPAQPLSSQAQQPFPGFSSAGALGVPISNAMPSRLGSSPLSCNRNAEHDCSMPSSWESGLSHFSLQSSLADFSSMPDGKEPHMKSEDSLNCSYETFYHEEEPKQDPTPAKKSKNAAKSDGPKLSLADRNRERQQRFRQRQKAKIESLENQVTNLTAQTELLLAEKTNMGKHSAKLSQSLQEKERLVAMLSSQVSQGALPFEDVPNCAQDTPDVQLSLTYCNPPLVLTSKQLAKLDALDLTKLWKEYVWVLSNLLKTASPGQWTTETERLDALTTELIQLVMHLWDSCPDFSSIKVSGFAEDSHRRDESEDENWRIIAQKICLTPDQVPHLTYLRHIMRNKLQDILSTRREAQVKLMACYEETAITSRDLLQQHQKVKQINELLTNGIKEENLLARDFEFTFYKKILRPEQRAICIVEAYPRFPDTQALANWIAACHGDGEAHSLMTNHATSSSTSLQSFQSS